MKIDALIKKLEKIKAKHGNLTVLDANYQAIGVSEIFDESKEDYEGNYPYCDWNLPKKWCRLGHS